MLLKLPSCAAMTLVEIEEILILGAKMVLAFRVLNDAIWELRVEYAPLLARTEEMFAVLMEAVMTCALKMLA